MSTKIGRRSLLKGTAIAGAAVAAAAVSSFPAPAIAQGTRQLKMVTTWPKNFPGLGTGAQRLADRITNGTEGRIEVKLFAAGELVPPFESFDAVSQGTADMYHAAEYYWQGKSKAFNFFATVPFGLTASEIDAWIYHSGGQALWDELSADFNLKPLMAGNTGVQWGGWFNKEMNSVEDYKGLKMRMPGLGGEVLRRVGANALLLPGGEIYPALEAGTIDATEWVGPWNDLAFGFYKITKYYYWPGFHEPGTILSLGINRGVWESLSAADQSLIESCAAADNATMLAEFNARNAGALDTLINEHGVQVRRVSDEMLKALGEASAQVVAEAGAEGGITQRVYESFSSFRKTAIPYNERSELAYASARLLAS
jgi:TRAP-type mannitol/chloroaromatic compound transport system substrate-binding protein